MKLKINFPLLFVLFISLGQYGCGVYSFSGASIDYTKVQTISIQRFYNEADQGPADMSQRFTEKIRDYFLQNTQLTLVENEGDLQIEGSIQGYDIAPLAPRAGADGVDISAQQRLKIQVKTSYVNLQDDTFDFDKNFSFYRDYDPNSEPLSTNEDAFVDEIFDRIIQDIFNASVANW